MNGCSAFSTLLLKANEPDLNRQIQSLFSFIFSFIYSWKFDRLDVARLRQNSRDLRGPQKKGTKTKKKPGLMRGYIKPGLKTSEVLNLKTSDPVYIGPTGPVLFNQSTLNQAPKHLRRVRSRHIGHFLQRLQRRKTLI